MQKFVFIFLLFLCVFSSGCIYAVPPENVVVVPSVPYPVGNDYSQTYTSGIPDTSRMMYTDLDYNTVSGYGNDISGRFNSILGDFNVINGDYNVVSGDDNTVIGNYNTVSGTGLYVVGDFRTVSN